MQGAFAQDLQSKIDSLINDNPLSKSAVVSVKVIDAKIQNTYAQKDSSLLLHPASTMQLRLLPLFYQLLGVIIVLRHLYMPKMILFILSLSEIPSLKSSDLQRLLRV